MQGLAACAKYVMLQLDYVRYLSGGNGDCVAAEIRPSDIGTRAGLFEVQKIGDEFFTFVVDCDKPKACSIVLRGASKVFPLLLGSVDLHVQAASSVVNTDHCTGKSVCLPRACHCRCSPLQMLLSAYTAHSQHAGLGLSRVQVPNASRPTRPHTTLTAPYPACAGCLERSGEESA